MLTSDGNWNCRVACCLAASANDKLVVQNGCVSLWEIISQIIYLRLDYKKNTVSMDRCTWKNETMAELICFAVSLLVAMVLLASQLWFCFHISRRDERSTDLPQLRIVCHLVKLVCAVEA